MLGKFKNEEELLKGYNELEKQFTQKCQQLSNVMNKCDMLEKQNIANNEAQMKMAKEALRLAKIKTIENELDKPTDTEKFGQKFDKNAQNSEPSELVAVSSNGDVSLLPKNTTDKTVSDNVNTASGRSTEVSPQRAQTQGVHSSVAVPKSAALPPDDDGQQVIPETKLLQQYFESNPEVARSVLQSIYEKEHKLPQFIMGGGAMALAVPNRPKTIREASIMATELFNK